jgi:hypothetical protein
MHMKVLESSPESNKIQKNLEPSHDTLAYFLFLFSFFRGEKERKDGVKMDIFKNST